MMPLCIGPQIAWQNWLRQTVAPVFWKLLHYHILFECFWIIVLQYSSSSFLVHDINQWLTCELIAYTNVCMSCNFFNRRIHKYCSVQSKKEVVACERHMAIKTPPPPPTQSPKWSRSHPHLCVKRKDIGRSHGRNTQNNEKDRKCCAFDSKLYSICGIPVQAQCK